MSTEAATPTPELVSNTRCSSCTAPIRFARTDYGSLMPFDADAVLVGGAYEIGDDGLARYVPKDKRDGRPLYVPHFATCVNADTHRKPRKKR